MSHATTKDQPSQGQLEIGELERVFDTAHPEHLSAHVLDTLLTSLLALYPEAPVSSLTPDGVMIAMPKSVKLASNPVLEARSGVDLLVLDQEIMATWDKTFLQGAARCTFHPAGRPELSGMLYMLDLRELHGTIVTVAVYDISDLADGSTRSLDAPEVAPRFATMLKDSRGFIVRIDDAMTKILGWSAEEMQARRSLEFIHPEDQALAIDNWMQMLTVPGPGRRVRLRHRRNDDAWVWFEVTNHNHLSDPENPCVISEMVDITDEMAAHEELRAREQLLDQLAEAAPVGLLQFDASRKVLYTNDRLHQILGVERAGTVDEQLCTVAGLTRKVLHGALEEVLDQGLHADIEVELRLPDTDEVRSCTMGLRALSDDGGTISGAIACVADVTDSARLREELKRQATFDALTGCYNRASVMHALEANIASGEQEAERAVAFVDLDCFKEVNDRYSHAVGDELLGVVAKRLRAAVREVDVVGRIGGDEFLIVCPGVGGSDRALELARRLADAQREDVRLGQRTIAPQVSIGVAWSQGDSIKAEALVGLADHAMYESKHEGLGQPKLAGARPDSAPRTDLGALSRRHGALGTADVDAHELALRASNVDALLSALQARDCYTEDHSHAIVSLALAVGRELHLPERDLLDLESVALLHDIGKIGICDAVLHKPEALSDSEWAEMHRHPDIGADIVESMPSLSYLAPAIRAEHERWDGRGYPNGLAGDAIPLLSRIVFVCDAYHAMTSDRPYRRALGRTAALREIKDNAGSQFCPRAADALAHVLKTMRARSVRANTRPAANTRARRSASGTLAR